MRHVFIFILLTYLKLSATFANETGSNEKFIDCEYSDTDWQPLGTQRFTCDIFLQAIDSPDVKIRYDPEESEKVEGLRFNDNKNLNFLPANIAEIFPNIQGLTVSGTYLSTLNSDDLKGLSKLKYASFSKSDLKVIEDHTFSDLSQLEELDLSDSNIRFIEENAFHGLTSLKTLYLGGNKLSSLEPKTFDGLTALNSLSLELNHLEYIDENLFSTNENLADIWLNKNKIIGFPFGVIENLPKFSYLDLQENVCVDGVYDESNVDELKEIVSEKCTAVAPARDNLPKKVAEVIEEIFEETIADASKNQYNIDGELDTGLLNQFKQFSKSDDVPEAGTITNDVASKTVECAITDVYWRLTNSNHPTCVIENQAIDSKGFKMVSSNDFNGNDLKLMSFARNKHIKFLPENIGKFSPHLEELSARNASLNLVTRKNFAGLKNLKSLNLADNHIKFIDPDAFDDLVSLEELDLSGNELENLGDEIFRKLKNLQTLRIGANRIHSIRPNLFKNLRNLVNISMSHQHISDLNENTFKQNTKLQNIWINSNKIKSLSPNMFGKLKNLEYVDIRDNKCIDTFYDQNQFEQMKTEILEKCGKGYKLQMGVKDENKKKKNKKPKKEKKTKEKLPKQQTFEDNDVEEKEVACEYEDIFWPYSNETLKTCVINEAIDDPNYLIAANSLFSDYIDGSTIQAISFKNNKNVKYLPKNLHEVFPNLIEFSAADAGLVSLEPENFKHLQNIKSIDLSGNGLKHVDRSAFKDLTSLEELNLDDNEIEEFEEETFIHTKVLKKLRMKGNKLKTIHEAWFEDMPELEEISFDISASVHLQPKVFENNPSIKDIEWNGVHYDGHLNQINDAICKYEEIYDADTDEMIEMCEIEEISIIENLDYVIKSSPRNHHVKKIVIANNHDIKTLPKDLDESFPALEQIVVENTALDTINKDYFQTLPHLRILKLRKNKIDSIDSDTFDELSDLEELDLSENSIDNIDDETFDELKKLKKLNLEKNNLNTIDPNTFKSLENLMTITLSDNNFHSLHPNTFKNNLNLEEIYLNGNSIDEIKPKTFEKLQKLKTVALLGNNCLDDVFHSDQLSDLESKIKENCKKSTEEKEISCHLKEEADHEVVDITTCVVDETAEINDSGYKITIDDDSIDPHQIKNFVMENNLKIKYLPENIGDLFPNLENLKVMGTSIDGLPSGSFKTMPKVKNVDFSKNKIKTIEPDSFNGLESIMKFNLSYNPIDQIKGRPFHAIPSIEEIDLSEINMKNVPESLFDDLPNLKTIIVDDKGPVEEINSSKEVTCDDFEFDDFDETFSCTISDQIINSPEYILKTPKNINVKTFKFFGGDSIKNMPKNIHEIFPNVKTIEVHDTSIEEVPDVFDKIENLDILDLSKNKIKSIKSKDFYGLPKLKKLLLNDNDIKDIDESSFDLPQLEFLSLDNNKISSIPLGTFKMLPNLNWISFDNNDDDLVIDQHIFDPATQKDLKYSYTKDGHPNIVNLSLYEPDTTSSNESYEIIEEEEEEVIKTKKRKNKRPKVEDSEENEHELPHTSNEIVCELVYPDWNENNVICEIKEQPITDEHVKIKSTPFNSNIKEIKIENDEDVKFLPGNIGEMLPNVEKLVVKNTSISKIPTSALENLKHIKVLDLSNNNLDTIDSDMLNDMPMLEELYLSDNNIKDLPQDLFKNVPELKVIKLDNNEISELEPEIFENLPKLTTLTYDGNDLPDEFIEEINEKLPWLDSSKSKIAVETTTVQSHKEIESPKEVECELGYSEWKPIDETSDDVTNIFTCTIKEQPITEKNVKIKPSSYDGHINGIKIENNPNVKFLPENIGEQFPNIQRLSVQNTSVSEIPKGLLDKFNNLNVLDLSDNKLKKLDPDMLRETPVLQEIDLSGNEIEEIPEKIFRNLPGLKIVDLDDNELKELDPKVFENNSHLKKLLISGNDIPDDIDLDPFSSNPLLTIENIIDSKKPSTEKHPETTTTLPREKTRKTSTTTTQAPFVRKSQTTKAPWRTTTRIPKVFPTIKTSTQRVFTDSPIRKTDFKKGKGKVTTTARPKTSTKLVNCIVIYEPSEFGKPYVYKCDITDDQEIDDPEVSLGEIPNGERVDVLKLDDNKNIKYLPDNIAQILPNLKEILAKDSGIDSILPGDFDDLHQLEHIDLSGNEIKVIDPETFGGLDKVNNIDLSNNQIEFVDEDGFGNLPSLKNLNLNNNDLTFIHPKTFENLPKLETISFEGNDIPSLNEDIFKGNPKLKEVKHSIKNLIISTTTIRPTTVRYYPTVSRASTTSKSRIYYPAKTQKPIDVRTTTARATTTARYEHRPKNTYPKEVACVYDSMYWLYSDDTLFTCNINNVTIDDPNYVIKSSPRNKRVKGLSFVDNKNLKFLPQNIDKAFPNLVEINAYNTSIMDIPKDALQNLPKLRALNIIASDVSNIDPNAFDDLSSLEYLELTNNDINELHPNTLKNVPSLKAVYLTNNKIKNLDPDIFENLRDLRNVSLENNELPEISKKLFGRNFELQNIWLNGNKIKAIDPKIFDGKRALEYVDLRDNDCIDEFFVGHAIDGIRNILKNKCETPIENIHMEVPTTTTTEISYNYRTTTGRNARPPFRRPTYNYLQTSRPFDYDLYWQRPQPQRPIQTVTIPSYDYRTESHITSDRRTSTTTSNRNPSHGPQYFVGPTPHPYDPTKKVKCEFNYHEFPGTRPEIYTCFINEQQIDDPEYIIESSPHNNHVTGLVIDDNKKVRFLPENIGDIFKNLNHLSAKHNLISEIPNLNKANKIKTLDLSDNKILNINPAMLNDMPFLEDLNLSGNRILDIFDRAFDNLPNLKVLDLSRNDLRSLPSDIFNKLPQLRKIILDNNKITKLAENIFQNNPKLETVNLNGNRIISISPHTFENLPNLGEVNLDENPCISSSYKPGSFYAMKSDIQRNCNHDVAMPTDTEVTTEVSKSTEKQQENELECIIADIFSPYSNEYLDSCAIGMITPSSINGPQWSLKDVPADKKIEGFSIHDREDISQLPNNLGKTLPQLTDISLTNVPITSISPKDFENLDKLKAITITGSSIKVLEPETFKGAPRLEYLDLNGNNLRHIDDDAFLGIPKLKNLDLSGNKIPKLSTSLMKPLPELKTLKLKGNDLQNIDGDLFKSNPELYQLNLEGNNLRSIDPDAFDRLPHLLDINLNKNDCIDRTFSASNMHMLRKIVDENCQPYATLKHELKSCKKEVEKCNTMPKENKDDGLKDDLKKLNVKIKQLNMQINKSRNALNTEKEMLKNEIQKNENLQNEIDDIKRNCARIDENHNMIIDMNCEYNDERVNGHDEYSCTTRNFKIKTENSTIEKPTGAHKRGKRDTDVTSLVISNQDTSYLPNGISNHFPYLNDLKIDKSGLTKITQTPLKGLPYLKKLVIRGNDIEKIEPNAFNFVPQLEHLDLTQNNIMNVPIKLFDNLPNLQVLNLNDNALITLPQTIIPTANNLRTLKVSNNNLNFIDPRIFKRLNDVDEIDFTNNKCIDKIFSGNDTDGNDYMSFIGAVSLQCTNEDADGDGDGFCKAKNT